MVLHGDQLYLSIFSHTESYGVISLHELEGNGVSHVFELAWISVWRGTRGATAASAHGLRSKEEEKKLFSLENWRSVEEDMKIFLSIVSRLAGSWSTQDSLLLTTKAWGTGTVLWGNLYTSISNSPFAAMNSTWL